MGDFLTRLGVNFLNHKLKITRGGIEVDNGNISGSSTAVGSFGSVYAATHITASGNITGSSTSTGSFGYLNIAGDTVIGGNLTLGDAATDSISFSAEINSNLIPDADSTYDIGSSSKNWRYGYIEQVSSTHVTASGNISGSTTSTGSFGYLNIDGQAIVKGMGNSNLVNVSSSFSTRVSNLKTDSGSFSTRVSNLKTDSGSFSTRVATEEANVDTLQSTMTSEQTNIDNLQTDSGSFSTRVSNLKTDSGSFSTRVSNLKTDSGSFSTRVSNLKTDSGSFSTRVTTNTLSGSILAGTGNIQGLGTTNNVQFNHITASGNISASGTIYADNFQSVGGDSAGISFADDLNITGHITASKNITSAGDIISTKANGVISGSVSSTGSFGRIEVGTFSNKSSVAGSSFTGSFSGSFYGQIVTFSSPVAGMAMLGLGGGSSRNGRTYVHGQSTGVVNWRVTHSLGEQYPAVTVYDEADNVIIPSRINAVGINNAEITFEDATSGNAHFSVGNGIPGITTANAGKFLRVASNGQNLEFTAANTDVTGALSITGSLTIEGHGHITASGNIKSAGDIISTKANGVISGSVTSTGSFGYLNVDGDAVIGGNITIGDSDSDSLSISADLTSNLIPNADSTYDLGSSSKNWRYGYIEQVSATHVTASGNISGSLTSTGSFGAVDVVGMSNSNLVDVSSSIASRVTTNEGKATKGFTIAMSVAL